MYRRSLKDHVKDELTRLSRSRTLTYMNDLIEESIAIDDDWYNRAMEKKYDGGIRGSSNFEPRGISRRRRNGREPRDPYGPQPMEFDFIGQKGPKKGGKQQQRGKKAFNCYSCGKPGHIAKNCRSKGMVPRPQLHIMEKMPDSDAGSSVPRRDVRQLSTKIDDAVNKADEIVQTLKELSLAAGDSESDIDQGESEDSGQEQDRQPDPDAPMQESSEEELTEEEDPDSFISQKRKEFQQRIAK